MIRSLTWRVVVVYLALRALTAGMLLLAARDQVPVAGWTGPEVDYVDMTVLSDGSWYRTVALDGYPVPLPLDPVSGRPTQNAWAFYPLFPGLARTFMGVTGLGFPAVASTLALVAGLGAAVLMAWLLADRVGERMALATVAVWAAFPAAVSLQLAYTESLAMLVLCGLLWAVMRRQWLVVASLALVLGLTRPIAVPLLAVVGVALYLRWRERSRRPIARREYTSGAVALGACGLAGLIWPAVVWAGTGSRTGYTDTMAAWRTDGEIVPLKPWLWMSQWVFRDSEHALTFGPVALAAVVTVLVVMVLGPWAGALGPELRTWCLAYPAYLGLVLDPFTSVFPYLLPLFPLIVVILGGGWVERPAFWPRRVVPLPVKTVLFVAAGVIGQVYWVWGLLRLRPSVGLPAVTAGTRTARSRVGSLRTAEGRSAAAAWALRRPVVFLLLVYGLSRVVVVIALFVAARWFQSPAGVGHLDPTVGDLLGLWDSQWYRRIAEQGYPIPLPADPETGLLTYSAWAFYPVFPLMVRGLMLTGLPFTPAAVGLNLVLGGVAVLLIWRGFRFAMHAAAQPARERLALVAAALWCLYPSTAVLLIPYTEALACVLIAGSLLLLMKRRYAWVAAGALALGFTRATAPALACAVLAHLVLRWRDDRAAGVSPLHGQRLSSALMLAATAASSLAWPAFVGYVSGLPGAFFDVQAAWGQRPDRGPFVLWLAWAWESHGLVGVVLIVSLVATYIALVLGRHGRWLAIELRAWALAYPLFLLAVVRPITSMWRFLLLDFPIAALVASVAMRTSTGARVVPHWRRRVAVVVVALVVGMFWFTAALLTYTPWGARPP